MHANLIFLFKKKLKDILRLPLVPLIKPIIRKLDDRLHSNPFINIL